MKAKKHDKKAETDPLHVIVGAAIVLTVLIVSIIVFTKYYGEGAGQIRCQMENLKLDCDGDNIPNSVDSCPCDNPNPDGSCKKSLKDCFDEKTCKCKPGFDAGSGADASH